MSERKVDLDLGEGHTLRWVEWNPDPALNPQYANLPDLPSGGHHGAIVTHDLPDGRICEGGITFDVERNADAFADRPRWSVESWDPLTISPSLLCGCGDHGFIRGGRWVRA